LAGINRFQLLERFIESQQFHRLKLDAERKVSKRNLQARLGTFTRLPGSSVIDKDTPHQSCGYREEMRSTFPIYAALIDQPEVNLMDQSSCLEAVFGGLSQ